MESTPEQIQIKVGHGRAMFWVALVALTLWLLELAYQYYVVLPGLLAGAIIRASALAGTTLIATSLMMSVVFKWYPRLAVHWRERRYVGVSGFALVCVHVAMAVWYEFGLDLRVVYFSLNPFRNAVIFGTIAFLILFAMAATSSDLVQRKIGSRWKFIHRFVYVAYLAVIFHFLRMDPKVVHNLAGQLLVSLTIVTILGQLYWWWRVSQQRGFRNVGFYVGLGILMLAVVLFYIVTRYYGGIIPS